MLKDKNIVHKNASERWSPKIKVNITKYYLLEFVTLKVPSNMQSANNQKS